MEIIKTIPINIIIEPSTISGKFLSGLVCYIRPKEPGFKLPSLNY